jgi:hypothetical protein
MPLMGVVNLIDQCAVCDGPVVGGSSGMLRRCGVLFIWLVMPL